MSIPAYCNFCGYRFAPAFFNRTGSVTVVGCPTNLSALRQYSERNIWTIGRRLLPPSGPRRNATRCSSALRTLAQAVQSVRFHQRPPRCRRNRSILRCRYLEMVKRKRRSGQRSIGNLGIIIPGLWAEKIFGRQFRQAQDAQQHLKLQQNFQISPRAKCSFIAIVTTPINTPKCKRLVIAKRRISDRTRSSQDTALALVRVLMCFSKTARR